MKVLVGYASASGSTKGIASEIGERLTSAGHETDVLPIDKIGPIDSYDAVVLGSAIHNQAWLPPASAFEHRHAAELAVRPVWLFSVSSVGDTSSVFGPRVAQLMRRMRKEPREIAAFRQAIGSRGHRNFAGVVERTHWGTAGNLFLKAFRGSYGDHRDWSDIDAWADEIAVQLQTVEKRDTA